MDFVGEYSMPLQGTRVLEIAWLMPGPWCGMVLGDFGADVIKIEIPSGGDPSRQAPPFYKMESVYFMNFILIFWVIR